ncbi:hypothetical protein BJX65DRAFT_136408 [Aspergillus insuetus]
MEPPTFGAPSFPHSTTNPGGLGSMAEGFTNWASQPSLYRTIAPWTSYRERHSNNTTTTTSHELSPASAPSKTICFPLTPFGPSASNIPGPRPSRAAELPMFESLEDKRPIKAEESLGNRTLGVTDAHVLPVARAGPIKVEENLGDYTLADAVAHVKPVARAGNTRAQSSPAHVSRANPVSLGSLNLETLSDSKILYYFGVLAIQTVLLPQFHLTRGRKRDRWGVKMTMYGMTFVRSHVYASRKDAKVDVCKEALKKLKVEHPDWIVPERPGGSLPPVDRDWVKILREYCGQQGLRDPRYTTYEHHQGYRHEVEVGGGMYFGVLRHYPDEHSSRQGAAHLALYDMLVRGEDSYPDLQGLSTVNARKESPSALVPRDSPRMTFEQHIPAKRKREDHERSRAVSRRVRESRSPADVLGALESMPSNANLQPLKKSRLAAIEIEPPVAEESRWKVTPSELSYQIRNLSSWTMKLERICNVLALEQPKIRIERTDGRLIEEGGEYTAGAWFTLDPFLTRASPIGKVQNVPGTRGAAHEACAQRVSDYLIGLVEEDS